MSDLNRGIMRYPSSEEGLFVRLRRRPAVAAATFGAVLALAALAMFNLPVQYTAYASLQIEESSPPIGEQQQNADSDKLGDPADIESHMNALRSTRLYRAILAQPNVQQALLDECEKGRRSPWWRAIYLSLRSYFASSKDCATTVADTDDVLSRLSRAFAISQVGQSRVIDVAYSSVSPNTAATMADSLAKQYLADAKAAKSQSRVEAIDWLKSQMSALQGRLLQSQTEIANFKRQNDLLPGQTAPIASERLSTIAQQLAQAQAEQARASAKLQELDEARKDSRSVADTSAVLDSRTIQDLKNQEAMIAVELSAMTNKFGPSYPELRETERQKAQIDQQIETETNRIATSLRRDMNAAALRVSDLKQKLGDQEKAVGSAGSAQVKIDAQMRDADVMRQLYVDYSKQVSQLETQMRILTPDAHLLQSAEIPIVPSFPRPLSFTAAAAVLAGVLAALIAIFTDVSDRSVRAASAIEAASGVRVLTHIPEIKHLRNARRLSVRDELAEPSSVREAVRALYAHLLLRGRSGNGARRVLITSSEPSEGKTFLTLALAHFAAGTGQRVIAVECDLRRPSFHRMMKFARGPGLTEFLRGGRTVNEVVRSLPGSKLAVLPAGAGALDSTELLASQHVDRLLKELDGYFDLIVLDAPPTLALMDSRLLARCADNIIYCVSWGRSSAGAVLSGIQAINDAGGRIFGIALSMVRPKQYRLYEAQTGNLSSNASDTRRVST